MGFAVDTGWQHPDTRAVSADVEPGQTITIRDHRRADKVFRAIKENIETQETVEDLDAYWHRESLAVDALHLFDRFAAEELAEVYETHRACLVHGGAARPAQPGIPTAQEPDGQDGNNGEDDDLWF